MSADLSRVQRVKYLKIVTHKKYRRSNRDDAAFADQNTADAIVFQALARARSTMSARSRDRLGAALMRVSAACALAWRPTSSVRQVRKAVARRAANCGFFGSSANTLSAIKA